MTKIEEVKQPKETDPDALWHCFYGRKQDGLLIAVSTVALCGYKRPIGELTELPPDKDLCPKCLELYNAAGGLQL